MQFTRSGPFGHAQVAFAVVVALVCWQSNCTDPLAGALLEPVMLEGMQVCDGRFLYILICTLLQQGSPCITNTGLKNTKHTKKKKKKKKKQDIGKEPPKYWTQPRPIILQSAVAVGIVLVFDNEDRASV